MTTTKIKRTITVETLERTVVFQGSHQIIWCEFCEAQVKVLISEQAAIIFDISLDKIYQGIENGKLHFVENENQLPSICVNSLKIYE